MIETIDEPVAEADLKKAFEWKIRPYRVGKPAYGLEYVISTERHIGGDPDPMRLGSFCSVMCCGIPIVKPPGFVRQPDRPEQHDPLARDRGIDRLRGGFSWELWPKRWIDKVGLSLFLQLKKCHIDAHRGIGMYPDEFLSIRLPVRQKSFANSASRKRLKVKF